MQRAAVVVLSLAVLLGGTCQGEAVSQRQSLIPAVTVLHRKKAGEGYSEGSPLYARQQDQARLQAIKEVPKAPREKEEEEALNFVQAWKTYVHWYWWTVPVHVAILLIVAYLYRRHREVKPPSAAIHMASSTAFNVHLFQGAGIKTDWPICLMALFCPAIRWADSVDRTVADHQVASSRGLLTVRIMAAFNLRNHDLGSDLSDPFVEASVGLEVCTTSTVNNNLNPVWDNEWLQLHPDLSNEAKATLTLKVYDRNKIRRHVLLGLVTVPVASLKPFKESRRREKLKQGDGELEFEVRWVPESEMRKGPMIPFWQAVCWLGLLYVILPVTMGMSFVVLVGVGVHYRQRLRRILGHHPVGPKTACLDVLAWSCCSCCAIAQEAREVDGVWHLSGSF